MPKKPTSLKDLKKASQENKKPGNMHQNIHAAIGNAKGNQIKGLVVGSAVILTLVAVLSAFYIFSRGMAVKITPADATPSGYVTLEAGLGWVSDEQEVFVFGSSYQIGVHAEDFISQLIHITPDNQTNFLEVLLVPKPAVLNLTTDPAQDGTKWILGNKQVSTRASLEMELGPGEHKLLVDHPYFEHARLNLNLKRAEQLNLTIPLSRIQGQISLQSVPTGASAILDGQATVALPYSGLLDGGKHSIQIQAAGYLPISDQVEITNTQKLVQRNYRMQPVQSTVRVSAQPTSARITLDGRSINNNSLTTINANQSYSIEVSGKGYETDRRTVRVDPGQTQEISIELKAAIGPVTFVSEPTGAEVFIGGLKQGRTPVTIDLQVLPTRVEFRRTGYRPAVKNTTPVTDETTTLKATLLTELDARLNELPRVMTNSAGLELVRFKPDQQAFFIGAKRGEIGQRANEIYRQMQLTKYFYAGKHEVTVGQFRKFSPSYGSAQANNMPATSITWLQAAQFCNWLSQQEKLKPFYTIRSGQVVGYDTYADGYRLPTETEWEWLARKTKRRQLTPFAWGSRETITSASGNLADESAKGSAPRYIPKYTDGYAKLAPVGSFPAELSGLHDMSGNVREWVNDRYALTVPATGSVAVNYFGPAAGDGHTVKGSSYKTANLTNLRAASRDKEIDAAEDIGFRVARYVYGAEDK